MLRYLQPDEGSGRASALPSGTTPKHPGAAGAVYINGAKQTDDKYISADDEAESVELVADGNGDWIARHVTGTWTVEA